jgi:hypothetical protein
MPIVLLCELRAVVLGGNIRARQGSGAEWIRDGASNGPLLSEGVQLGSHPRIEPKSEIVFQGQLLFFTKAQFFPEGTLLLPPEQPQLKTEIFEVVDTGGLFRLNCPEQGIFEGNSALSIRGPP